MIQSFRKIKIDPNDKLYSQIIRSLARGRCRRCQVTVGFQRLQCAHIMGRVHKRTRFLIEPQYNAVALCASCHSWFDSHKIDALIFDERKRVLSPKDESYTWLVSSKIKNFPGWNYSWDDLYELYALSHHTQNFYKYTPIERKEIKEQLQAFLRVIDSDLN